MKRSEATHFSHPQQTAPKTRRAWHGLTRLALVGSALVACAAAAQSPRAAARGTMDTNGDGALDAQELHAAKVATFERADADGDGYLTAEEAQAARMAGDVERRTRGITVLLPRRVRNAESAEERFERLDADGDGRISEKEFLDAPHALLRFDTDGDGRVTREEIERGQLGALRRGVL